MIGASPWRTIRALRHLLRAAHHDPLWAVTSVVLAPFRAGKVLAQAAFALLILALVGFGTVGFAVDALARRNTALHAIGNIAVLVLLAALLWRFVSKPLLDAFGDANPDSHGTARFATAAEVKKLTRDETGLLISRDIATRRPLRYSGPAHLLTIAPTRTGKGVGTLIPNLLATDRSVVCIDPKGENARVTARQRRRFGPVHVLDPFSITGEPSAAFNPLDRLDPDGLDAAEEAATLADALVFDPPGEGGEAHWNEEAKALIAGLILHIAAEAEPHNRHLGTLRRHLTLPPDGFRQLLVRMQGSRAAHGLVARAANRHLGKSDREASGVLSSAQRHTHFLDSPRMTAVLERSDLRFADLRTGIATVFLVLPPHRLAAYARWLRLMVGEGLADLVRSGASMVGGTPDAASPDPVLLLLDELAALGPLQSVERALGLLARYGVQLWPILQDVHQLRATYGARAGTFLSNAGVLQVFGVNDHDTARLVSDLLGQETAVFGTMSRALDAEETGLSVSAHHTGRPLLTPDEVRTLPASRQLLFLAGHHPVVAAKLRFFADPEFAGLFDAPYGSAPFLTRS